MTECQEASQTIDRMVYSNESECLIVLSYLGTVGLQLAPLGLQDHGKVDLGLDLLLRPGRGHRQLRLPHRDLLPPHGQGHQICQVEVRPGALSLLSLLCPGCTQQPLPGPASTTTSSRRQARPCWCSYLMETSPRWGPAAYCLHFTPNLA